MALPSAAERLAWLAEQLPQLPGSGIVYCLTVPETRRVAAWLQANGVDAHAYSGRDDPADRLVVEQMLAANACKAVVATSALGMGYDKPDLAFVVHYQAPDSPVAYYQQVGRAGRALDRAEVILLGGPEDRRIWEYFTTTAFPPRRLVDEVLGLLDDAAEPLGLAEVQRQVNLGQGRLDQLLKILDVEGAVRRVDGGYLRGDPGWVYDADRYRRVTAARRAEQAAMLEYLTTDGCLMAFLRRQLRPGGRWTTPTPPPAAAASAAPATAPPPPSAPSWSRPRFGSCATRTSPCRRAASGRPGRPSAAAPSLRPSGPSRAGRWVRPPTPAGGRCSPTCLPSTSRSPTRWSRGWPGCWAAGDGSSRRPGSPSSPPAADPPWSRTWPPRPAGCSGCRCTRSIQRVRPHARPQAELANSFHQYRNAHDAFALTGTVPGGPVLLVDDVRGSGWTLTTVAGLLRDAGAGPVHPLALLSGWPTPAGVRPVQGE